jgi:hypothetical protein
VSGDVIAALIAASASVIGVRADPSRRDSVCPWVREDLHRSPAGLARQVEVRPRAAAAGRLGAIDRRRAGVGRLPRAKGASAALGAASSLPASRISRVHVTSASTSTP